MNQVYVDPIVVAIDEEYDDVYAILEVGADLKDDILEMEEEE